MEIPVNYALGIENLYHITDHIYQTKKEIDEKFLNEHMKRNTPILMNMLMHRKSKSLSNLLIKKNRKKCFC